MFELNGKVALVTGANRGLGFAMCMALAEAGADIRRQPDYPDSTPIQSESI